MKLESPPGEKLDPDGRLRVTLTRTAVRDGSIGLHIETRRDERLVEEEWWKLTDAGLVVTQLSGTTRPASTWGGKWWCRRATA